MLALVAYLPALDAITSARTARGGALLAALASLGLASVAYEATVAIGPPAYLLAMLLTSLPFAAVGAVAVRLVRVAARVGWGRCAVVALLPALWCAAEWLPAQPWLLGTYALPLGVIGYSQVDLPTLQLASLSSVTAVSAAVLLTNALLLVTLRASAATTRALALTALAGLSLLVAVFDRAASDDVVAGTATAAAGAEIIGASAGPLGDSVLVRLVQPNLPDNAYLATSTLPEARNALIAALADLATGAGAQGNAGPPDLTVMPEAAWPGPLLVPPGQARPAAGPLLAAGLPQPLLFGAPSAGRDPAAASVSSVDAPVGGDTHPHATTWFANSVFQLADDRLALVQDKIHLVPIAEAGLRAGTGPAVTQIGDLGVSALICYDVVFPATSRAAVLAGADLLTVLTDDSFAARGDVPKLHVRLAVFRAVENGVPVALASNTGPSALIDSSGRIVARSPALVATALTAELPLLRRRTAYSVHGDWLGVVVLAVTLASSAVAVSRGGGAGSFRSGPT